MGLIYNLNLAIPSWKTGLGLLRPVKYEGLSRVSNISLNQSAAVDNHLSNPSCPAVDMMVQSAEVRDASASKHGQSDKFRLAAIMSIFIIYFSLILCFSTLCNVSLPAPHPHQLWISTNSNATFLWNVVVSVGQARVVKAYKQINIRHCHLWMPNDSQPGEWKAGLIFLPS